MAELTGPEYEHALSALQLQNYLPYLQDGVEKLQNVVVNRMAILQEGGKLTPEMALAGWYEFLAYRRILKRTKTNTIISAAQVDSL